MATRPTEHHAGHAQQIVSIPIDRIRILNPRARSKKTFAGVVESIATVGLIRPLTNQNPLVHSLRPIDMMRQGWLSSFRQASQQ